MKKKTERESLSEIKFLTKALEKEDPELAAKLRVAPEIEKKITEAPEIDKKAARQLTAEMSDWSEFCDTADKELLKHIPPVAEDRPDLEVQFIALRTVCIAKALESGDPLLDGRENPDLAASYYKNAIAYLVDLDSWVQKVREERKTGRRGDDN